MMSAHHEALDHSFERVGEPKMGKGMHGRGWLGRGAFLSGSQCNDSALVVAKDLFDRRH